MKTSLLTLACAACLLASCAGAPAPGPPPSRIDQALQSMQVGEIAFNTPDSMSVKKAETVVLLLSPRQTAEELTELLKKEEVVGGIENERVRIHDRMQAALTGDGFHITPVTPEIQHVSTQEPTRWEWNVRAEREGTLKLNYVLNAIVDLGDGAGPNPRPVRTFNKTYVVKVGWRDGAAAAFFKRNWFWLWLPLSAPVAVWAWGRKRRRRRGALRRLFAAAQNDGVFISYRRADSAGHAGRLRDALAEHFGAERVFMDMDSIGYGADFARAIEQAVGSSAVLIVVIGREWLSVADEQGRPRLENSDDFVRLEVEAGLKRGLTVIPALVEGARMPGAAALPEPLKGLAVRNAIELSDNRWQYDVGQLVEAVEEGLSTRPAPAVPLAR